MGRIRRGLLDDRSLLDEAIAQTVNGYDVSRFGGVLFDLLTELRNVVIDRARDRGAVVSPNFVEQLIAGHRFTSMPNQVPQDFKLASGHI